MVPELCFFFIRGPFGPQVGIPLRMWTIFTNSSLQTFSLHLFSMDREKWFANKILRIYTHFQAVGITPAFVCHIFNDTSIRKYRRDTPL